MAETPRFRWWYLLLLLPVAGYFGARVYVGHRIERAIDRANTDGNRLTVGDYEYGLLPIHLRARNLDFLQDRENFRAEGSLSELSVEGLHVFSLIGSGPARLNRVALRGLDADLVRHPGPSDDSSAVALEVTKVDLDSIFLRVRNGSSGREIHLSNLGLGLHALRLPFRPTRVDSLAVSADSLRVTGLADSLDLRAGQIAYSTDSRTLRIAEARLRRGSATDLTASDLRLSGFNPDDMRDGLRLGTLYVGKLGGGARVWGPNAQGSDSTDSSGGSAPLYLDTLRLPDLDVRVTGDFGDLTFTGAVDGSGLEVSDQVAVGHITVDGKRIDYGRPDGPTVNLRQARLEQESIRVPLAGSGPTRVRIPTFKVEVQGHTVSGQDLVFNSGDSLLTTGQLKVTGDRVEGGTAGLRLDGFDRDAWLRDGGGTVQRVVAGDAEVRIRSKEGGRYDLRVPEARIFAVVVDSGASAGRVEIENTRLVHHDAAGNRNLEAEGIYLTQYDIGTPLAPARQGPLRLRVRGLHLIGVDEPIDYRFTGMAYASRGGTLTLDSLRRVNRLTPEAMFQQKVAKSWLQFGFDGLRAEGIHHAALLAGEEIYLDSLLADDMRLRVVEDLSLNLDAPEKPMPIQALRRIGPRVVLKAARIPCTDITYGVVDSILDPKTIHFGAGTIAIRDLDTDYSNSDSTTITFDATFEETTPMHAEFRLARDSSGRNYAARGELGEYDLSRVNPLMRIAADAIVETGVIEKLSYHSRMVNDTVTGDMTLLYRDLDLKIVGSGSWIKNLLSGVVLKNDNVRGEDFRPGRIFHEHPADKSFFNSYWKGLVSGMRSSALSDIALPDELD